MRPSRCCIRLSDLGAAPDPSIRRRVLQSDSQFLLLFLRQQHGTACSVLPVIAHPFFPSFIPTPNDPTHPSGCVTELLGDLLWRLALLCLPQNIPMDAFDGVLRTTIATIQLFLCQLGLDFDALSHTS